MQQASHRANHKKHSTGSKSLKISRPWWCIAGCVGLTCYLAMVRIKGGILLQCTVTQRLHKKLHCLHSVKSLASFYLAKLEPKNFLTLSWRRKLKNKWPWSMVHSKKQLQLMTLLFNMLIWGPPGTGKTMMAQRLARSSGLDFIYFSVHHLISFHSKKHWSNCTNYLNIQKEPVKNSDIIDEAERLLGKRSPGMQKKQPRFWLTSWPIWVLKPMIICNALSNRPEDLDEAFLSRCDYRLFVGAPDQDQRERIIKKYVTDYLVNTPPGNACASIATKSGKWYQTKTATAYWPCSWCSERCNDCRHSTPTEGFVAAIFQRWYSKCAAAQYHQQNAYKQWWWCGDA